MNIHSIKFRIILLCILLVVFGYLFRLLVVLPLAKQEIHKLITTQQLSLASYIADEVDQKIRARQETLERIAGSYPYKLGGDPDAIKNWLTHTKAVGPFFRSGMLLILQDGTVLASTIPSSNLKPYETLFDDTGWLQNVLHSDKPQISRPFKDPNHNTAMIAFGVGVRNQNGTATSILLGLTQLDAAGFLQELNTQKWGNGSSFLIISPRDKQFLGASDPSLILKRTPAPGINLLHDQAMSGYSGAGVTMNAQGVEEIAGIQSVQSTGWFVVSRIPTETAYAPIYAIANYIILAGALLTAIMLTCLAVFLPHIFRRLDRATQAVGDMASGRKPLHALPEDGKDEAGALVRQFNLLVKRIQNQETALRRNEAKLAYMATHDTLTKLYNRPMLMSRLQHSVEIAQRHHAGGAVLFCDLDGFKSINDSFGHDTGDQLLIEAARCFLSGRRQTDTVARLGGDEFVIVLTDLKAPTEEAKKRAQQYLDTISAPFNINGKELEISLSIGVVLFGDESVSPSQLLSNADTAMYRAKNLGKNRYCFYEQ